MNFERKVIHNTSLQNIVDTYNAMLDVCQKRVRRDDLKLNNISVDDLKINDIYFNSSLKNNVITSKNSDLIWYNNYVKYTNNTNMFYSAVGVYEESINKYSANIIIGRSTGVFNTVKNMMYATEPYNSIIAISDTKLRTYYFVYPEEYKAFCDDYISNFIATLHANKIMITVARENPIALSCAFTDRVYIHFIMPFAFEPNSTVNIYMVISNMGGKNFTVGTHMPIDGDIINTVKQVLNNGLNLLQDKDCYIGDKSIAIMKIMALLER